MAIQNKDIGAELKGVSAITSESWDGSADLEVTGLDTNPDDDLQAYRSAKFICEISGGSANDVVVLKVQHSSDDGDDDAYTDVEDAEGNDFSVTLNDAADSGVINLSNAPFKRYVRLIAVDDDATVSTSVTVQAAAVLGGAAEVPVD